MLKHFSVIAVIAALGLGSTACTQTEQRTAGYGASGAALGALAGGAIRGTSRAAMGMAALGATVGGLIANVGPHGKKQQTDRYGRPRDVVYKRVCYYKHGRRYCEKRVIEHVVHHHRYHASKIQHRDLGSVPEPGQTEMHIEKASSHISPKAVSHYCVYYDAAGHPYNAPCK